MGHGVFVDSAKRDAFYNKFCAGQWRGPDGFGFVNIISVTLATHNRDSARRFAELVRHLPQVQEAHALTGEMDYHLKVVTPDLKALSAFVNDILLPHEAVAHVKTAIVLETLKESGALPLEIR